MFPLSCTFRLYEIKKYKHGMMQWQMFYINIIEIFQGIDKVNYADGEECWSYIFILLMGFIQGIGY
jgi:hypothetical protein